MTHDHWNVSQLAGGDDLHVQVLKEGGRPFRSWITVVEHVDRERLVTWNPPGHIVRTTLRPEAGGEPRVREWHSPWGIRNIFWPGRPYNLLEVYHPDGRLEELYVHVASPPALARRRVTWTDYELDVVLQPGGEPQIIDEDEFAEAVLVYGYSPGFQDTCYQIARTAAALLRTWTPAAPPATGRS